MLRVALLTIADDVEDAASVAATSQLRAQDVVIAGREWVRPIEDDVRRQLVRWIASPAIDTIVVCGRDARLASAAVAPLVTERAPGVVRCATTTVFVMPASGDLRPPLVASRPDRIPTEKIMTIGDLPPSAEIVSLDLRAGGRRGLWMFSIVALSIVVGAAGYLVHATRQPSSAFASSEQGESIADEAAPPVTAAAVPLPPQPAVPARAPSAAPSPKSTPPHVKHALPAPRAPKPTRAPTEAPVDVPAALTPASDDGEMCTEENCARHHNERECCTPFRHDEARDLDAAAIRHATAGIDARVHDCRDPQVSDGLVRVSVSVGADGGVQSVRVVEAPDTNVGACVATVLRTVSFPASANGAAFVYRVDLLAGNE